MTNADIDQAGVLELRRASQNRTVPAERCGGCPLTWSRPALGVAPRSRAQCSSLTTFRRFLTSCSGTPPTTGLPSAGTSTMPGPPRIGA